MKIEEVKKLAPLERYLYFIKERHSIYLKKKAGYPKPWTDDEILQTYYFTNVYRELDKTTVWFRENFRDPWRDRPAVILGTTIFRWFNLIETGKVLLENKLLWQWDSKRAVSILGKLRDDGVQIFTGAFMINSPGGERKLEAICRRIDNVWRDRGQLVSYFTDKRNWKEENLSMEEAHKALVKYEGLGGFMAYEIVCDLRYTTLLENAPDKLIWSNPGPGAIRGLYRVLERPFEKGNNASAPPRPKDWDEQMSKLLKIVQERFPDMPPFEMREIEMVNCEHDKAERLLWGDGRAKRKYNGKTN
jgi:hypothetical protein